MKILFLGDIVGRPGRKIVKERLPRLRESLGLDMVAANGENASGGLGLSAKNARELLNAGVDVLTSGNHVWKFQDVGSLLRGEARVLRPANYPPGAPGRGVGIYELPGCAPVAVLNVQGRTFMPPVDCPFRCLDALLAEVPDEVRVRLVDFHAEATSEKISLGWHLDDRKSGRVSALAGTHTHVQTNDARVLPGGMGYVTDLGMCGPRDGCLGMKPGPIVQRFLNGLPAKFEVAGGVAVLQGALFDIDESTGRARSVRLVNET
ncbi:TIGR00282 family metallophosphoesterase [Paucidesulfovibrio longus]|uniref:TIGR00282 family metallophosphoesterase n=1 Tax=Paucidesulfovibrio longus TaxID=889 RepID=UPI0003B6B99D|nr:TIGR00282 family metallophosphoesterase [Paucidesulfovibrio longus]